MEKISNFFSQLLSSGTEVSSKRVAALFTLINLLGFSWFTLIKSDDHVIPQFMFDSLALIVGGGLGLTVFEKLITKSSNPNLDQKPEETTTNPPAQENPHIDEQLPK